MALLRCADYELLDDENKRIDAVKLSITKVTDSSVTLKWSRYMDNDFSHYVVLYSTGDIVDWNDKVSDSLMFDFDTVKIVQHLNEMTRYYFRVMVTSNNGKFSGSNTVDTITCENLRGKLRLNNPERDSAGKVFLKWSKSLEACDRYLLYADSKVEVDTADSLITTVYSDTMKTIESDLFGKLPFWVRVYAFSGKTPVAKSNIVEIKKN